jgi:hypothetical protein
MMNLDMVRAGGEGMLSAKKNPKGKDKNVELGDNMPALFETEEQPLHLKVPEGWSVRKKKQM